MAFGIAKQRIGNLLRSKLFYQFLV